MANVITRPDSERLVLDRWNIASSELETHKFRWLELEKMFKLGSLYNLDSRQDERGRFTHPNQSISRVSSSLLKNAVETVMPRMMGLFNTADGWFTVIPSPGSKTKNAQAVYVEDKLKLQLDENAYFAIFSAISQMVKFGVSVLKVRWDVEIGKVVTDVPFFDAGGRVMIERRVRDDVVFRGNKLDLVPYWQFAPDPKGRFIEECEYVIEDNYASINALIEIGETTGVYDMDALNGIKKQINAMGGSDPRPVDSDYTGVDFHRQDVRVLDYWEDHKHIAYAIPRWGGLAASNGNVINKNQENIYYHGRKPYVDFRFSIDEKTFYSQGVIEPLRDLHNIQSTALNQFIDAITMNLRPMRLIDGDLDVDVKELMNYVPNKPIVVEDLAGGRLQDRVHEFKPEITGILNSLLPFMQQTNDQANRVSGITDYVTGNPGVGANRTASGVALLTQNAENRGLTPILLMSLSAQRMLKLMHENNQQFGDPREPLAGDFSFIVFGDSQADRITRVQGLQSMLPLIMNLGGDMLATARRLGRAYGIVGLDELLPRDGSMEQNQMQMAFQQMMQMMSMQQGQGGGGQV